MQHSGGPVVGQQIFQLPVAEGVFGQVGLAEQGILDNADLHFADPQCLLQAELVGGDQLCQFPVHGLLVQVLLAGNG